MNAAQQADVQPAEHSVSADAPDWSREAKRFWQWHPSRSLLASVRAYERVRGSSRPDRVLRRYLAVLRHRFWSVVTGAEIPLICRIDGGLLLPHPNGVVIHPGIGFQIMTVLTLTTGTAFLMWIGEQITERGVSNGISLLIFASIVSGVPRGIAQWFLVDAIRCKQIRDSVAVVMRWHIRVQRFDIVS